MLHVVMTVQRDEGSVSSKQGILYKLMGECSTFRLSYKQICHQTKVTGLVPSFSNEISV